MSLLADRLRAVVAPPGPRGAHVPPPLESSAVAPGVARTVPPLESLLGGEWHREHAAGPCFVIEKRQDAATRHGRHVVGEIAARLEQGSAEIALLSGGASARRPLLFFDLETTGLSGGAGTYAFLVGCGWFDADGAFLTRQFVLTRFADERPLLATVAAELARAGALVSYNGRSFDAPLLETRFLFHRLEWAGGGLPHIDVLHPARRFWRDDDLSRQAAPCSLGVLERQVLGARRVGDVPGFEIPARYFEFIRSGDARPLAAVIEHNRLDLLSLAGLTARLLQLLRSGPMEARSAREAVALGRTYARAGLEERAVDAYRHAVGMGVPTATVRITGLRLLALTLRRGRRFEEAAVCWRQLLDAPGCPGQLVREASEALAIHHEHRVRDLTGAQAFALKSLAGADDRRHPAWTQAVRHRLARIQKKMEKPSSLELSGPTAAELRLEP